MFQTLTKLVSTNSGLILIQFLWLPVLTRLYSPEQFGNLGITLGIAITLSALLTLRLESVIPLQVEGIQINLTYLLVILSILMFTIIFLFSYLLFGLDYWRPLVIALLMTVTNLFSQVHACSKRYNSFLLLKISLAISLIVFQYFLRYDENGLVNALIASFIFSISLDQISNSKYYLEKVSGNKENGVALLIENRTHLYYGLPESILQRVSANGIQLLVPQLYGLTRAVLIFNVIRLASYPQTLVASSLGDMFIGSMSESSQSKLAGIVRDHMKLLLYFYIVILSISSFLTDDIFILLLGNGWGISTYFKLFISFSIFHSFYANYGRYFHYINRLKSSLLIYLGIVSTQFGLVLLSSQFLNSEWAIKLLLFLYPAAFLLPTVIVLRNIFGNKLREILIELSPLIVTFTCSIMILLFSHTDLKFLSLLPLCYVAFSVFKDVGYRKV